LKEANARANDGRGSSTIRSIILALEHNDWQSACREWECDGDKLIQYPELKKLVIKHFGCRLHLVKGCDKRWCSEKV
jgi:hypothetical protein